MDSKIKRIIVFRSGIIGCAFMFIVLLTISVIAQYPYLYGNASFNNDMQLINNTQIGNDTQAEDGTQVENGTQILNTTQAGNKTMILHAFAVSTVNIFNLGFVMVYNGGMLYRSWIDKRAYYDSVGPGNEYRKLTTIYILFLMVYFAVPIYFYISVLVYSYSEIVPIFAITMVSVLCMDMLSLFLFLTAVLILVNVAACNLFQERNEPEPITVSGGM